MGRFCAGNAALREAMGDTMNLEALRHLYARPVESFRRIPPRMSTESVTDRRIRLVRDLLDNGEGIEAIENEPESPPPNSRVIAALTASLDRLAESDLSSREKALRAGALVRIPWMDGDALDEVRDQVPEEVWIAAARLHEFGESRQERERFLGLLSLDGAIEFKVHGVPTAALEAWNLHFLRLDAQHLLIDVGPTFKWGHLERLVGFFDSLEGNWAMSWLKANGAGGSAVLSHLLETDQATITSPDRLRPMLSTVAAGDSLISVIEKWDALDPGRIPPCIKQWHQDLLMLKST